MKKIICDVCGTSYPETADQCPICGCARPETGKTVSESGDDPGAPRYKAVKGGRFSSRNVRKRIRENGTAVPARAEEDATEPEKDRSSTGLVIAVIALLLCICAVIVYIYFHFFGNSSDELPTETDNTSGIVETTTLPTETQTEPEHISCTAIELESYTVTLTEEGASWLLHVTVLPENSDDSLSFESKNPEIAAVTDDGKITAVSEGKTAVVITCGEVTAEFEVVCDFPEETTVPPTTTAPKHENVRISKEDVTLKVGESFDLLLRDGSGETMDVTWTVSDEGYVTINGNKITAVKAIGRMTVSCTFEGETYSCIVRVK